MKGWYSWELGVGQLATGKLDRGATCHMPPCTLELSLFMSARTMPLCPARLPGVGTSGDPTPSTHHGAPTPRRAHPNRGKHTVYNQHLSAGPHSRYYSGRLAYLLATNQELSMGATPRQKIQEGPTQVHPLRTPLGPRHRA